LLFGSLSFVLEFKTGNGVRIAVTPDRMASFGTSGNKAFRISAQGWEHVICTSYRLSRGQGLNRQEWSPVKWVTRQNVHVDRVACPWLIKRFVDANAEFLFVPPEEVQETAAREGAIPFDVQGVELGHKGDRCSFDAIIAKYNLTDPALLELARIVRAADTARTELAPESVGLEAIAAGSMMIARDDHEAIEKQEYLYDALYAYCKLRLVKQSHANEIEKLDPKRRQEFLRTKVREHIY